MDQSQVRGEEVPEEAWLRPLSQQRREEAGEAAEREEVSAPQQRQRRRQDAAALQARGKLLPLHAVRRSELLPGRFRPTNRVGGDFHTFVSQRRRSSGASPCSAPTSWTPSSPTSTPDPDRGVSVPPEVSPPPTRTPEFWTNDPGPRRSEQRQRAGRQHRRPGVRVGGGG